MIPKLSPQDATQLQALGIVFMLLALVFGGASLHRLEALGSDETAESAPFVSCAHRAVRRGGEIHCEGPGESLRAAEALWMGQPLDPNRAPAEALTWVPGIGPALAKAIVEAREIEGPFASWDDLDQVRGIGPKKLEAMKAWMVLNPPDGTAGHGKP